MGGLYDFNVMRSQEMVVSRGVKNRVRCYCESSIIAVWAFAILMGCSTVERYRYYSPDGPLDSVREPAENPCGWKNFGGQPDTFVHQSEREVIHFQAYQYTDFYLFGPWFASVVPVFPISWFIDLFLSSDLTVTAYPGRDLFDKLSAKDVLIKLDKPDGTPMTLYASSISAGFGVTGKTVIKFPVNSTKLHHFTLRIENLDKTGDTLEIYFSKTVRWAWSQWSINCP
jgi:hypothetical protein